METIIKGGTLMVFESHEINGALTNPKSIPLATSHTLRISAETSDVSHKDIADAWSANDITKFSWEATTDNLYSDEGMERLFTIMKNKEKVYMYFAPKSQAEGTPLPSTGTWTAAQDKGFVGLAYITSLEVNAQNGENATYSATFTGAGKLEPRWS